MKVVVGLRESGLRSLKSDIMAATKARKADVKRVMYRKYVERV